MSLPGSVQTEPLQPPTTQAPPEPVAGAEPEPDDAGSTGSELFEPQAIRTATRASRFMAATLAPRRNLFAAPARNERQFDGRMSSYRAGLALVCVAVVWASACRGNFGVVDADGGDGDGDGDEPAAHDGDDRDIRTGYSDGE
jgi:hypothetical protein